MPHPFGQRGKAAERQQQPWRRRHTAVLEGRDGQRREGDKLALRYQDHPRHREYQHRRDGHEGIDRAVDDTVLQQEQENGGVHARLTPGRRWIGGKSPRARWLFAAAKFTNRLPNSSG